MDEDKMITRSELAQRWRVSKSFVDKQMVIALRRYPVCNHRSADPLPTQ